MVSVDFGVRTCSTPLDMDKFGHVIGSEGQRLWPHEGGLRPLLASVFVVCTWLPLEVGDECDEIVTKFCLNLN